MEQITENKDVVNGQIMDQDIRDNSSLSRESQGLHCRAGISKE